jgi:type II secretory pathway pseudopilin PulG
MRPSRPWLPKRLRSKQPLVPDGFSLLETVLVAVLLIIATLSTYRLFQVNIQVSKVSHELDAADRELSGKIQQIREFGRTFKWCAQPGSPAQGHVDPVDISIHCSVNADSVGSQSYYAESAGLGGFIDACNKDVGSYDFGFKRYNLSADDLLPVLVARIRALNNPSDNPNEYLNVDVELAEKTTRRLLIFLQKRFPTGGLGRYRQVTRFLYLVPEVAKWCP